MERQEGYYWVKLNRDSKPEVGRYVSEFKHWYLTGTEWLFKDSDIYFVKEEQIISMKNQLWKDKKDITGLNMMEII